MDRRRHMLASGPIRLRVHSSGRPSLFPEQVRAIVAGGLYLTLSLSIHQRIKNQRWHYAALLLPYPVNGYNIQDQVEDAIWLTHERIIGNRRVPNNRKILSVYEEDVHVIVRGKSDAEVEFGNKLFIAEQEDGLVVDYKLMKDKPVGDPASLLECMDKIVTQLNLIPSVVTGDRGFDSPTVRDRLDKANVYNAVACRSVPAMEVQLQDPTFRRHQKRRAQTEGRIAIIKGFTSNPMLQRGFEHREIHLGISVISHNLWKLAVMRRQQELQQEGEAGAKAA